MTVKEGKKAKNHKNNTLRKTTLELSFAIKIGDRFKRELLKIKQSDINDTIGTERINQYML